MSTDVLPRVPSQEEQAIADDRRRVLTVVEHVARPEWRFGHTYRDGFTRADVESSRFVVGMTGTHLGLTTRQFERVPVLLSQLRDAHPGSQLWLMHGACRGADVQVAQIARELGFLIWELPGYSARDYSSPWRASLGSRRGWTCSSSPLPYLMRDAYIVAKCDFLVACPKQNGQVATQQGGTARTYRMAEAVNRTRKHVAPADPDAAQPIYARPALIEGVSR